MMLLLFLLVMHDIPLPKEHIPPFRISNFRAVYWLNPIIHRDFALTWLARFLMFLSYTTAIYFLFYFLQDAVHYSHLFPGHTTAQGVQTLYAINVGCIVIASLLAGMLSDKLQRRKVFLIAAGILMMVGLLLYALFPTWLVVIVATGALGSGTGIFLAVNVALGSQVLPAARDRGKDTGLINAAFVLPTIFSPVIAGITLSTLHNYLVLFSLLAVIALIGALLILPIKTVR